MIIYLVGDDGHSSPGGDLEDALQVLPAEDGAAGVAGVVDDDGAGAGVDLRVQHLQIRLPPSLRLGAERRGQAAVAGGYRVIYGGVYQSLSPVFWPFCRQRGSLTLSHTNPCILDNFQFSLFC